MLTVPRLRMLYELNRLGTIARVAQSLAYSPSAVSQQLAALEQETGVVLLERVGRGVKLTEAARTLVGHTAVILETLERAEGDLARASGALTGELHVASFQTVVVALAPAALGHLAAEHPDLRVRISQCDVGVGYADLLRHDVDLMVDEEYPDAAAAPRPGVDSRILLHDPVYLALPASGPFRDARTLADLAEAPWALDLAGSVMGEWSRRVCRSAGFEPRIAFDTPDPLLPAHLARAGLAAAFVPGLVAGGQTEGYVLRRLSGNPKRVLSTAVRAGGAAHPAVQAFRDALAFAARAVAPDDDTIASIPRR